MVGSGPGKGKDCEKKERGPFLSSEKAEMILLIRSPAVEGHAEWQMLDQSWWLCWPAESETEAHVAEAKV